MSAIKGFSSQKKTLGSVKGFESSSELRPEYVTVQNIGSDKSALDVVPKGVFDISTDNLVEAGSEVRKIILAAHGAVPGNIVRFTSGLNLGVEASVHSTPNASTIILGVELSSTPLVADTFDILGHVTPKYDSSGSISVSAVADNSAVVDELALDVKFIHRHDYSATNVTTGAYVELLAATPSEVKSIEVFDSSGYTMLFAVGIGGGEIDKMYIAPGGNNDLRGLKIPAASRISVKAADQDAVVGELTINFYG